jgi:hypothetical protein
MSLNTLILKMMATTMFAEMENLQHSTWPISERHSIQNEPLFLLWLQKINHLQFENFLRDIKSENISSLTYAIVLIWKALHDPNYVLVKIVTVIRICKSMYTCMCVCECLWFVERKLKTWQNWNIEGGGNCCKHRKLTFWTAKCNLHYILLHCMPYGTIWIRSNLHMLSLA